MVKSAVDRFPVSPYQVLLLDWDGTVVDSRDAILASFAATFAHFGETAPLSPVIQATIGMKLTEAIVSLCPRAAGHEEEWLAVYRDHSLRQEAARTRLFEGMRGVIEAITEQGLRIGIVSNKSQAGLEAAVQRCGLERSVDFVVGTMATGPRKPEAALFHEQVRPRVNRVASEQILMVGDTEIDLAFARNAGIVSCWAAYGYGQPADCIEMSPRYRIGHPAEMLPMLELAVQ